MALLSITVGTPNCRTPLGFAGVEQRANRKRQEMKLEA